MDRTIGIDEVAEPDGESGGGSVDVGVQPRQPAAAAASAAAPGLPPHAYPSLKAFLGENASLIFFVGSLTSLTTFIVNLQLGWLDTYLKAVLLAAAGTVWFEFHAQWPEEIRLDRSHRVRRGMASWRLLAFSYLMQFTMVLIAVWSLIQAPEVVVPLFVMGAVIPGWRRFVAGHASLHQRWVLPLLLVAAFVGSELILERLFPHTPTLVDRFVEATIDEIQRLDDGT